MFIGIGIGTIQEKSGGTGSGGGPTQRLLAGSIAQSATVEGALNHVTRLRAQLSQANSVSGDIKDPLSLPDIGVNPLAVYGMARLVDTYTGPLTRVVRASDSATHEVYPLVNGKPNMSAANTFRGASETVADIAHDQSGNNLHATQTVNTNRPRFRSENAWHGVQGWTHDSYIAASAGTKVSKHFDFPVGLAVQRDGVTIFSVAAPRANYQQSALFEHGTAATARLNLITTLAVPGLRTLYGSNSTPTLAETTKYTRMDPEVYVLRTNSANTKIHNGDVVDTVTRPFSATLTGGRIGGAQSLTDYGLRGEMLAHVVYPGTLSDANIALVKVALRRIFDIDPMQNYLVFDGDSLTEGIADTNLMNMPRLVANLMNKRVMLANSAVYGVTAATTYARRVQLWDGLDRTVSGIKTAVIGLGINDVSAGTSASTIWNSYLKPYIAYVKSRGYIVVVGTLTPTKAAGFDAPKEAERLALNALILANAEADGYTVADYTTQGAFDAQADADNTTNYTGDKVHHTTAGFLVKALLLVPILNDIFDFLGEIRQTSVFYGSLT